MGRACFGMISSTTLRVSAISLQNGELLSPMAGRNSDSEDRQLNGQSPGGSRPLFCRCS